MRERLIELLSKKYDHFCDQCGVNKDSHYIEGLADYLLANGVIVPPCKVGNVVYVITTKRPCFACDFCTEFCHKNCRFYDAQKLTVKKATVCSVEVEKRINKVHTKIERNKTVRAYYYTLWFEDFGKTVFLTKEEAEAALRKEDEGK